MKTNNPNPAVRMNYSDFIFIRAILGGHSSLLQVALGNADFVEGQTGVYKIGEEHVSPAILQVQGRESYLEGQTGVCKIGEDHMSPAILQVQGRAVWRARLGFTRLERTT